MTDAERILNITNDGLKVFKHYLGTRCDLKVFCNPYRGDCSPSCKLYHKQRNGIWRWVMVDFGDASWTGDCFHFVGMITKMDVKTQFRDIVLTINIELALGLTSELPHVQYTPITIPDDVDSKPSHGELVDYDIKFRSFSEYEYSWWGKYGITKDVLNRFGVKCVLSLKLTYEDGHFFTITSDYKEPCYAYSFNSDTGYKVYRPGNKTRFMQLGNLPRPYIFGLEQLPEYGNMLFFTGGEKDALTLSARGFNAVCLNSETAKISLRFMKELCPRFETIYILYDSDKTGVDSSELRYHELTSFIEEKRLNNQVKITRLPLKGSKSEKDISDYFRVGFGLNDFLKLL